MFAVVGQSQATADFGSVPELAYLAELASIREVPVSAIMCRRALLRNSITRRESLWGSFGLREFRRELV
jgi:hypothetical protein